MENFQDSLAQEVRRLSSSRDGEHVNDLIRPITTGLLDTKTKTKLHSKHNIDRYADRPDAINIRPRAPLQSKHSSAASGTKVEGESIRSRKPRKKHTKTTRNQKSKSLQVLWESLHDFAITNVGRSLVGQEASSTISAPSESVHFVNINDYEDDGGALFTKHEPIELANGKLRSLPVMEFSIPELPSGKLLAINILSTWGDPHYVGLMGIEIFDNFGHPVLLSNPEQQIWANPPDINILPEYNNDPRTVDNLIDGVNHTCDDLHAWLTPFTRGKDHFIYIEFDEETTISMIRIWNYNKNRIHSYRGARYIEIMLDDTYIFKGEIRKSMGILQSETCNECILFTMNDTILALVEKYDPLLATRDSRAEVKAEKAVPYFRRGLSPTRRDDNSYRSATVGAWDANEDIVRPMTGKAKLKKQEVTFDDMRFVSETPWKQDRPRVMSAGIRPSTAALARSHAPISVKSITLTILSSWGDLTSVGLTGIMGVDENLEEFILPPPQIFRCVNGALDLLPTSQALVRGNYMTTDMTQMWHTTFSRDMTIVMEFDLGSARLLRGLRVWNYNGPNEGIYCGVKHVEVSVDGKYNSSAILRKAPGVSKMQFGQFILLTGARLKNRKNNLSSSMPDMDEYLKGHAAAVCVTSGDDFIRVVDSHEESAVEKYENDAKVESCSSLASEVEEGEGLGIVQQYETPLHPCGSLVRIVLLSSFGDPYYIGLNGLQLLDQHGQPIEILEDQLHATPYRDVNDMEEIQQRGLDARSLENLIHPVNDTFNDRFMWLAPLSTYDNQGVKEQESNCIFVLFDEPVTIGCVKFWNYSKTPERGVQELEIFVDDVLVFKGNLRKSPLKDDVTRCAGSEIEEEYWGFVLEDEYGEGEQLNLSQSIIFTNNPIVISREASRIPTMDDSIDFIDEGRHRLEYSHKVKKEARVNRPMTTVTGRRL